MRALAVACLLLLALALAGCGRERPSDEPLAADTTAEGEDPLGAFEEEALTGRLSLDGSSTVAPLMSLAAERFRKAEPGVKVTVGTSGTGGGFERFCRGETDVSNASRPIEEDEEALCAKNGVATFPVQVANDGISIVVNQENTWATCLTVDQLKKIWEPGSKVDNWQDLDPTFPDVELELFGAGHGLGHRSTTSPRRSWARKAPAAATTRRARTTTSRCAGVSGVKGALGYFGLSYYPEYSERLKALAVDGGEGCVEPSVETVQDGSYKPLSRPLFSYVNEDAIAEKPALDPFLTFVLDNEVKIAKGAKFVPMTPEQIDEARTALESGGVGVEE